MKTNIILASLLFIMTNEMFSQVNTDYFGMPTSKPCPVVAETKFNGDDMPVTELQPTVTLPSPTSMPSGIAWDGTYLWVCGYNEYRIFCVDPNTGDTIKTVPVDIRRPYGICYRDSALYILDNENARVLKLFYTGTIADTINLFDFGNIIFPTGLYVCSLRIWFNDTKGAGSSYMGDSTMYIMNQSLAGFPAFADFPSGIACDGNNLWVTDNVSQTTSKINGSTFQLTQRFTAPGGAYPNGLAWGDNGLWYINNESDEIYFVYHDLTSEEIKDDNKIIPLYPNPANSYIKFGVNSNKQAEILDMSGKVLMTVNTSETIDISNLITGIYFVRIQDVCEKLIISR